MWNTHTHTHTPGPVTNMNLKRGEKKHKILSDCANSGSEAFGVHLLINKKNKKEKREKESERASEREREGEEEDDDDDDEEKRKDDDKQRVFEEAFPATLLRCATDDATQLERVRFVMAISEHHTGISNLLGGAGRLNQRGIS